MDPLAAFSPDYATARARFRAAAEAKGWVLQALPIAAEGPRGIELTIDVARLGPENPRRVVVVSSGTHGVEGYFGSAVQLALLEGAWADVDLPDDTGLLLVHAVNPYGFAWNRRVNEDNVDLNRNFLLAAEGFEGVDPG